MYLGIDIGGTFTDIVCLGTDGSVIVRKISSRVTTTVALIAESLPEMSQKHSLDLSQVKEVTHGTTVATNAILQRSGAKTGLITTRGFRDVLELRRIRMPVLYDLFWDKPPDLAERPNGRSYRTG